MKRADVIIAGLVIVGVFGLVFAGQIGLPKDWSKPSVEGVVVGQVSPPSCAYNLVVAPNAVCASEPSPSGCVGRYKENKIDLGGGKFHIEIDYNTPLGCDPPAFYHGRCYNQANSTPHPARDIEVTSTLWTPYYSKSHTYSCTNKRDQYECKSVPVQVWRPLPLPPGWVDDPVKRSCNTITLPQETCHGTYPTIKPGC